MADRITVDAREVTKFAEALEGSSKKVEKATLRAANRSIREAFTLTKRGLQTVLKLPNQKFIKDRRRLFWSPGQVDRSITTSGVGGKTPKDAFARLWIGLNAVPARKLYFGPLKQTADGVIVKRTGTFFGGAFLAYRKSSLGVGAYKRIGPDRFPIKIQGVPIDTPEVRSMIGRVVDVTESRYSAEVQRILKLSWDDIAEVVN